MNKNLINKLQNYTLDTKVLSIDSNDRDKNKFPNPSEFEISCPQDYCNVESIRVLNIKLPYNIYNITEDLQNNKLSVSNNSNNKDIILIDGHYDINELIDNIKKNINTFDSTMNITLDSITNKISFISDNSFQLNFTKDLSYNLDCNNLYKNNLNYKVYDQHSDWGLGSIIGFEKKIYNSQLSDNSYIIVSPYQFVLNSDNIINHAYMEIDKFNCCDEIVPYKNSKNSSGNNGIVNSFFSKIPILSLTNSILINSPGDNYLTNYGYYQPPIEKISKLKFRFRYHNGQIINLSNKNVSFTLEINQIRNEIKNYDVRTPFTI
tara:strand:- start:472 stop:1431 length:960 start_codon:yes stop_codon:yes gene_type:complete